MSGIVVSLPGMELSNEAFGDGFQLSDVEGWWETTAPRGEGEARENAHGDFSQDAWFLDARYVTVSGVFQSYGDPSAVFAARRTLTALHELTDFRLTVVDPSGAASVTGNLSSKVEWDVDYAPGCASFEFTVKADDPRKYGQLQVFSTGIPTDGEGITDPVDDPVSEGEPGNLGRVQLTNTGTAPSEPITRVSGGVADGFELRCLETGHVVRVTRPVLPESVITVDHGAGEVWVDGQSILPASYVPVGEWFQVPPGGTCTIQWAPVGAVTANPQLSVEFAEASW